MEIVIATKMFFLSILILICSFAFCACVVLVLIFVIAKVNFMLIDHVMAFEIIEKFDYETPEMAHLKQKSF